MYNKTHWQDRVVDPETGEVIQEGTFMSAERFNNIENGIAANNELINEAQSDIESIEAVLKTSVGVDISMSIDPETYVLNLTLKNQNGQTLREQSIDLPIESMFIGVFFNEETKTLVLTMQSGETIEVPLTAIISGLVNDSRKIAGLDLKDDIATEGLRQALNINNVGNFKAVSTATSQGLSSTEQANARANVGLGNVENKSSATILEELTNNNIANALGFTPMSPALKGSPNGLAELDPSGKVPSSQLPSYVDDVIEATTIANFPATGEAGKIYVDTSTNKTYRWSGSAYVEISASLALGETSSTAYRGDRGKVAYDHSQATHARTDATKTAASSTNGNILINGTETPVYKHPAGTNPHGATKSDVGLGNVPNVATNDQTPSYTEATTLAKLASGEKLSVAFGKISKAITDLISHIGDSVKHITSTERTNWNAAKTKADTNETNISNANTQIADIYNRCGGGKNLFKTPTNVSSVYRDLTFSWDSDGVLTVTGIPSYAGDIYIPQYPYITTGSQFTVPYDCIMYILYSETHADMWVSLHGYSADGQQFYKSSSALSLSAGDRIAGLYFKPTNTTTDYNFTVKFMIIPKSIGINAGTYVPYIPTNAELQSSFSILNDDISKRCWYSRIISDTAFDSSFSFKLSQNTIPDGKRIPVRIIFTTQYGMTPIEILFSVNSTNASPFTIAILHGGIEPSSVLKVAIYSKTVTDEKTTYYTVKILNKTLLYGMAYIEYPCVTDKLMFAVSYSSTQITETTEGVRKINIYTPTYSLMS